MSTVLSLKPCYLRFTGPAQHEKGKLLLKVRLMSNDSVRGTKQLCCCKCCPLGMIERCLPDPKGETGRVQAIFAILSL